MTVADEPGSVADVERLADEWRHGHTASEPAPGARPALNVPDDEIEARELLDLASWIEHNTRLLRRFGMDLLTLLSQRPDPSQPVPVAELARLLSSREATTVRSIDQRDLAALITAAHSRGFAPGLVREPGGYAIAEDHMSFKLTRNRIAKDAIAAAAARLVRKGQKLALDGGSTTLPIAEQIVRRLEDDELDDLTVITNSLPVAERLARFVEQRGWSDSQAEVRVVICAGLVRPNTRAVAEVAPSSEESLSSLRALIERLGGVDWAFVGANGLTAADGITMPTAHELPSKRVMLASAAHPYVVADASKFGQRHAHLIADWQADLTVLTNVPELPNPELQAVLRLPRRVRVEFVSEDR